MIKRRTNRKSKTKPQAKPVSSLILCFEADLEPVNLDMGEITLLQMFVVGRIIRLLENIL